MLTKRKKQVLDFIKAYLNKHRFAPSLEEIKKHCRLSSVATVHYHVRQLQEMGYLDKMNNRPRTIAVPAGQKLVQIPILGAIAAGQPIEAIEDNKENIAIPQNKINSSDEYFALRVSGNSMIDENINDGDIILVRKQSTAENGQKVVALIDNHSATLKKFYKERGHIRLQPANKFNEPIIIDKEREFVIQGAVVDVIKNTPAEAASIPTLAKDKIKRYDKLPLNKIICGDVIEELRKIPDNSCDVIIADPPYNIGKDFGNNLDKRDLEEYITWCKTWINECVRLMKPHATMFIYGFSEILAYLSVEIPLNRRWLIWHYTNKNVASLQFWQRSHEAIICCWKNDPIFNRDEVREPYTEGFLNGAAGKVRAGTTGRFSRNGKETIYKAHEAGALPRDVIKIPALAGGAGMTERWFLCKTCNNVFKPEELKKHINHDTIKHPTQKPLELSEKLIKSSVPKNGGIVLVPFAGVGSECVAAKQLGLSYIGIEINPDYIRIAGKRLDTVEVQETLKLF
ncbi:MAG: transcriptional repressor LexA [Candidatus Omnitrophica bacterium]|nr:transcriptional repressor LexA [Candidatus Omnitrophota bacterium]